MDFNIKYDMEKYAHSLNKIKAEAGAASQLEAVIENILSGSPRGSHKSVKMKGVVPVTPNSKPVRSKEVAPASKSKMRSEDTDSNSSGGHPITSKFGPRGRDGDIHKGIDIDGEIGDPVYAFDDGVAYVSYNSRSGKIVTINHTVSGFVSSYYHLSAQLVENGQTVKKGDRIGSIGNTGGVKPGPHGDGSHLHFELKFRGSVKNPEDYNWRVIV